MVTLKDIAERAGVSMMTVSRVMNSKEGKVSEKTASRIRSLADEMGYIPNSSARSLAAKSSQIIAVILRDSNTFHPLSDPYNASFLDSLQEKYKSVAFMS
jgi:DNA-binding LacI/PurR family transcriptional regulator